VKREGDIGTNQKRVSQGVLHSVSRRKLVLFPAIEVKKNRTNREGRERGEKSRNPEGVL